MKVFFTCIIVILTSLFFTFTNAQNTPFNVQHISSIKNNIKAPYRVEITNQGNIYVTDVKQKKVVKYDNSHNFLSSISAGSNPYALAINSNNEVFVGDFNDGTIYKLDEFDTPTVFSNVVNKTTSMVFDNEDLLYVIDYNLKQITVLDNLGNYVRSFGQGDMIQPVAIEFDHTSNRILVAEHGGIGDDIGWFNGYPLTKVWVYDKQGNQIGEIGDSGSDDGEFYRIQGMDIGKNGSIFIVDPFQGKVNAFENNGTFMGSFGEFGKKSGNLHFPIDIAIDNNGKALVTSMNTGKIEVYFIDQNKPSYTISAAKEILCEGENTNVSIKLTGTPPWTFSYTINGTNPDTVFNNTVNPYIINTSEAGLFELTSLSDANYNATDFSNKTEVKLHPYPTSNIISNNVDLCDGDSTNVNIKFTGVSPFTFKYNDGITNTTVTIDSSSFSIPVKAAGTYTVNYIRGGGGCVGTQKTGSATITINTLKAVVSSIDTAICPGTEAIIPITLTGAAPWTFTYAIDGINQTPITTSNNPYNLTATQEGTYNVVNLSDATTSSNCNEGSAKVTFITLPTATLTTPDTSICEGTSATISVQLTGVSPWKLVYSDGLSYTTVSNIKLNSYSFSTSDSALYEIVSIEDSLCLNSNSSNSTKVSLLPLPSTNWPINRDKQIIYEGDSLVYNISFIGTAPYNFTYLTEGKNPININAPENNYTLYLKEQAIYEMPVISDAYCTNESQQGYIDLLYSNLPTSNIQASETTVCEGDSTPIVIDLTGIGPWNLTYTVNNSNPTNIVATTTPFTLYANQAGEYQVTALSDSKYVGDLFKGSATVNINVNPIVYLGADTAICRNETLTLDAGTFNTYTWNDGSTNQTLSTDTAGSYSINITDANGCTNSDTINIAVNELPVLSLASDTTICENEAVLLNAGSFETYNWSNGSTEQTIQANKEGKFSVTVTDQNACVNSDSINININPLPIVNLGTDTSICQNSSINLDAGSFSSYLWNNGSSNQTLNINTAGEFIVIVTDSNKCTNADTINITATPLPQVNLGEDTSICQNNLLTLNAGSFSSYSWNNGTNNQTLTLSEAGEFSVTVVDSNGCSNSDTISIFINPLPFVNLGVDTNTCQNNTITLDAGSFSKYLWNNGSTDQTLAASTSGEFSVKITDTNGCSNSDTISIFINPLPFVNLGGDTNICQNNSITFDAGSFSSYSWNNGSINQTLTTSSAGEYHVTVTDDKGCKNADTINLSINPIPIVNLGSDTAICQNNILTLNAGIFNSYLWNNGSTNQNINITEAGKYSLTATDANGCINSDTISVSINPLPVVNLGADTAICQNSSLILDPGSFKSYIWNNGISDQTMVANASGEFSVTVTDNFGCKNSDQIQVDIMALPMVYLGNDTMACEGEIIVLDAGEGFESYTWNTQESTQAISIEKAGNYEVEVADSNGCKNSSIIKVDFSPLPIADFSFESNGLEVVFVNSSENATSYKWDFGDGAESIEDEPTHFYNQEGNYTVTLIAANDICGDSTLQVVVPVKVTSVNISNDNPIKVYPNPSFGNITIELANLNETYNLSIYSTVGKSIFNEKAIKTKSYIINVNDLEPGIYLITLSNNNKSFNKPIIIQK